MPPVPFEKFGSLPTVVRLEVLSTGIVSRADIAYRCCITVALPAVAFNFLWNVARLRNMHTQYLSSTFVGPTHAPAQSFDRGDFSLTISLTLSFPPIVTSLSLFPPNHPCHRRHLHRPRRFRCRRYCWTRRICNQPKISCLLL